MEDLITKKVRNIHITRIRLYDNAFLDVNEELTEYLKNNQSALYLVDEFKALKRTRSSLSILVSWDCFPGEDTWQGLEDLYRDVAQSLREYLDEEVKNKKPVARQALKVIKKLRERRERH